MKHMSNFCIIVLLFFSLPAFAQQTLVKASGSVTAKNGFGEIAINGKQYQIDPMCEILDHKGYSLAPSSVEVESRIIFEYENDQSRTLPVIKQITVLPR